MNIWLKKECSVPSIFVVIVIVGLWIVVNGEFAFYKWIFPLLSGNDISNDAFGIKDLIWVVLVKSMRNTY